MADPAQNPAPSANSAVEWDAPATIQTGTPTPSPVATAPTPGPAATGGVEWDAPADTTADQDQGVMHGAYQHFVAPYVDTAKTIGKVAFSDNPQLELGGVLKNAYDAQAALAHRGVGEIKDAYNTRNLPGVSAGQRAATYYEGGAHLLESALPGIGPQYSESADNLEEKPNEGVGDVLGDIGTALLPKVVEGVKGKVADVVDKAQTAPSRSLAGLIAKAPGMGDNFDPKAVSHTVEPLIQQSAKANPELAEAATSPKSTPEESYKAFQELVNKAQTAIDQAHRQVLGKVANTPVSVRPVLEAMDASMPQGLDKFAPQDAAAIKALRDNIANAKTLGDLNGLRVYLNTELSPEFKMDNVAVGRTAALDKAMRSALGATKDAYYDNLQHVTGQDFRSLKMAESNLMTYQEALANSRRGQFAAQAAHEAPTTGKQKIAKAGEIVGSVIKGDKAKLAQSAFGESPMAPTQAHIQRFLKNIPDHVSGFDANAPATPQPRQLESSSTVPDDADDTYQHEKGAPVRPSVVTPFYERPLLPETAGQGLVTEPSVAQPHPGVNASTATTRLRQPIFKKPEPTPPRTITVSPEGTATVQRPALPSQASTQKTTVSTPEVNYVKRHGDVDIKATEASLPPVKDGYVRLFRSESPTTKFTDVFDASKLQDFNQGRPPGKAYTDSLNSAEYYKSSYGKDAKTTYIDVPQSVAQSAKFGDSGEYVIGDDTPYRTGVQKSPAVSKVKTLKTRKILSGG